MLRAILSRDSKGRLFLSKEELHHLLRVRRLRPDEEFLGLAVDEQKWFRCRLASPNGPLVEKGNEEPHETESSLDTRLAVGLIQRDRFEWILQKGVELGVSGIVPIRTRRTEWRIPPQKEPRLLERWGRILQEAVKQCGRKSPPRVSPIRTLDEYLGTEDAELRFYLDESTGRRFREVLESGSPPESCAFLIGPEGGWEAAERELIQSRDFAPVHLGPRILRTETAALATLSILQYVYGDYCAPD